MPLENLTPQQLEQISKLRDQLAQGGPKIGLLTRLRSFAVTRTTLMLEDGEQETMWVEGMNRKGVTIHLSLSLGKVKVARSIAWHVLFDNRSTGQHVRG